MVDPVVEFEVEAQVAAPGTGRRRGPVLRHDVVGDGRTEGTQCRRIAFEVDPDVPLPWTVLPTIVLLGDW